MLGLGGLASGLDTASIIEQLLALERRPKIALRRDERQIEARQAALRDITSRLHNLKSTAVDLRSAATWADTQTVESSDTAKLGARRLSTAASGAHQVEVSQLARAEQRTYDYTAQSTATQLDVKGVLVELAADATLDDAVASINAASGITVMASNVAGQLVLTAKASGTDASFTALGSSVVEDTAKARLASNANYSVDGVAKSSQSNVVTDAVTGLELTLKGLTAAGTPVTVTVGELAPDKAKVAAKVKAFVEQHNSTVELMRQKTTEKTVVDPKTDADHLKGLLRADPLLSSMLSQFRTALMTPVAGNPSDLDELAEIGISTGATTGAGTVSADAVAGKLVLDEPKLMAALDKDPAAVERMLAGSSDGEGIAQRLERAIDPAAKAGGTIDERLSSANGELARTRRRMVDVDRRVELKENALRAQFQAMERAMAASQAQGSWLTMQLAGL